MSIKFEDITAVSHLDTAIQTGYQLLEQHFHAATTDYMPILSNHPFGGRAKDNTLFSGNSGLALFFLQLYRASNKPTFLHTAEQLIISIVAHEKSINSQHFGLYKGRMGMVYVLCQFYEVAGKSHYLNTAVEFTEGIEAFIYSEHSRDDLFEGLAGTLLGLLYLYQYKPDQTIRAYIQTTVQQLVERAAYTADALYWDVNYVEQEFPSDSYTTGTAGVAYVLNQLAMASASVFYQQIAQLAGNYKQPVQEDSGQQRKSYPFTLKKLSSVEISSGKKWFDRMDQGKLGLDRGWAAWGYWNLMQAFPDASNFLDIQITINSSEAIAKEISEQHYLHKLLEKHFKRSQYILSLLVKTNPDFEIQPSTFHPLEISESYAQYVRELATSLDSINQERLLDLLEYEFSLVEALSQLQSNDHLLRQYHKAQQDTRMLYTLSPEEVLEKSFQLADGVWLLSSQWNWYSSVDRYYKEVEENLQLPPDEYVTLLKLYPAQAASYEEVPLADWYVLLCEFQEPTAAKDLFKSILDNLRIPTEQFHDFRGKYIDLLMRFLGDGYIQLVS